MEPANHFTVLRRYWRLLAGCTLAALLVGWLLTPAGDTVDNARWKCKVAITPVAGAGDTVRADQVLSYAQGADVATAAAKQLGIADAAAVIARRTVTADSAQMLTIATTGPTRQTCSDLATAYSAAIIKGYSDESARSAAETIRRLQAQADEQQRQLNDIQQQFTRAPAADQPKLQPKLTSATTALTTTLTTISKLQNAAQTDAIQQWGSIDARQGNSNPLSSPSRSVRLGLAVALGLALGVVSALMLSRMDTRLRTRNAVEEAFNLPVIGEVPQLSRRLRRLREPLVRARPSDPAAEAYRSLRSTLLLTGPDSLARPAGGEGWDPAETVSRRLAEPAPVVLVTSGTSRDGRTTTIANLAAALAETGREVLVLDCDFRHPELHAHLGVGDGPGMAELLSGERLGELDDLIRPTNVEGVSLITGGHATAYPAALVLRAAEVLRRARRHADVILVDTSPLLHANDAYDLVQHADAVLVTVRSGNVTPEQADRVAELLSRTGVPVAGVALLGTNGRPSGRRRRGTTGGGTAAPAGRGGQQPAPPRPAGPATERADERQGDRQGERAGEHGVGRGGGRATPSWARRAPGPGDGPEPEHGPGRGPEHGSAYGSEHGPGGGAQHGAAGAARYESPYGPEHGPRTGAWGADGHGGSDRTGRPARGASGARGVNGVNGHGPHPPAAGAGPGSGSGSGHSSGHGGDHGEPALLRDAEER
ncbi:polysaccharide biosynthesis tyrosine autokinase [Kitasatospora sp. NBC_00458]|uniref:polysaccharide biosynthesis tyrosine autokinase n=1 Tax=Kitasatospora sp. NBC_00458 TaxID=2903568 RepID=UPI002E18D6FB